MSNPFSPAAPPTYVVDSRTKPRIDFAEPPRIGTQLWINWWKRQQTQKLTLLEVRETTAKDGSAKTVLIWRDHRGMRYRSDLRADALQLITPHAIDFAEPPPVGFRLECRADGRPLSTPLTLVAVEPYIRKRDGADSFLLRWVDDDGQRYTSGMRGTLPKRDA